MLYNGACRTTTRHFVELPEHVRQKLIEAVKAVDPQRLPALNAVRRREAER